MTAQNLRRFYEVKEQIRELESEAASLKDGLVQAYGTGKRDVDGWLLSVSSFNVARFDRKAAEVELGDLSRFERFSPSLRVEVKPGAALLVGASP